jgi:hypothetical protein
LTKHLILNKLFYRTILTRYNKKNKGSQMKKPEGRFIGGFYGLAPFTKYSEEAPNLKLTYAGMAQDALPKLAGYFAQYGVDHKFLKAKTKQEPGVSYQPGHGN